MTQFYFFKRMLNLNIPIIILLVLCSCCSDGNRFHTTSKEIVKNESDYYVFDPIVGHVHRPNARREFTWPEHHNGKVILQTNNLGFRRDSETLRDKQGKFRILVAGDSHIDGVINNNESCCSILENLLNQSFHNKYYEVDNGGTGYYCPHHYLGMIHKYLYLTPDLYVVIVYGGNDFVEICNIMDYKKPDNPGYYDKLKEAQSFNACGISQGLNQIYYFKNHPESLEKSVKWAGEDLQTINNICKANNISLMVLLLPTKMDIEWATDEFRLNKCKEILKLTEADLQINIELLTRLSAWLDDHKIDYLNLYYSLKGNDQKLFWNQDYHLNDHGHKIIAETLFAACRDKFIQKR